MNLSALEKWKKLMPLRQSISGFRRLSETTDLQFIMGKLAAISNTPQTVPPATEEEKAKEIKRMTDFKRNRLQTILDMKKKLGHDGSALLVRGVSNPGVGSMYNYGNGGGTGS